MNKNTEAKDIKLLQEELMQVNRRLEESEAMKSHFVSNITNEIINPFTSIIGLSKSILSVKKEDWKRVITMVAMIHSEAFNLDFQLRNIFVAAKIEAGDIQAEAAKVDILRILKGVVDQLSLEARKKKVEVNISMVDSAKAYHYSSDAEKLKTIMSNLLSNAIKYSFDEGEVVMGFCEADQMLHFWVQDEGRGISEANQKIIFDRFKRLDSGINSINRGHGLGLSVIKGLLDILGGQIEIDTSRDKGARFDIYIPIMEESTGDIALSGSEFLFDDSDCTEVF